MLWCVRVAWAVEVIPRSRLASLRPGHFDSEAAHITGRMQDSLARWAERWMRPGQRFTLRNGVNPRRLLDFECRAF
jgi:hypothetical protein